MSKNNFQRFITPDVKGAKLKEKIRQEKKKQRNETREYFAQKKLAARTGLHGTNETPEQGAPRPFSTSPAGHHKGAGPKSKRSAPASHPPARTERATGWKRNAPGNSSRAGNSTGSKYDAPGKSNWPARPATSSKDSSPNKSNPATQSATDSKRTTTSDLRSTTGAAAEKKYTTPGKSGRAPHSTPGRQATNAKPARTQTTPGKTNTSYKPLATGRPAPAGKAPTAAASASTVMPLNKYIAHAGICSRRDAATLVKEGKISVDDQVITEPGYKVSGREVIKLQGKKLTVQKNHVYILLNKPKDHITTMEDPEGRKTVMDIVKKATTERVYPIGRLDRNTTGVLLLTNDGALAQKLSHPSYQVRKIYEVTLDKPLTKKDFDELLGGISLDDGFIAPDALAYADARDKHIIGIEIHSGRNRIVRRMFEKLGYDVRNLDRVMYANLTKKNVERGKWRFLQEKEIRLLKFINASYSRKK